VNSAERAACGVNIANDRPVRFDCLSLIQHDFDCFADGAQSIDGAFEKGFAADL
jgi:hypothetical protein